jgi:hypothetical protein
MSSAWWRRRDITPASSDSGKRTGRWQEENGAITVRVGESDLGNESDEKQREAERGREEEGGGGGRETGREKKERKRVSPVPRQEVWAACRASACRCACSAEEGAHSLIAARHTQHTRSRRQHQQPQPPKQQSRIHEISRRVRGVSRLGNDALGVVSLGDCCCRPAWRI